MKRKIFVLLAALVFLLIPAFSVNAATTYKVTYKLNGGTNHKSNITTFTEKTEFTLKNPTKTGYTFKGWYSDAKYKTKVTKIKKGTKKNITLYAKWSENTYTIIFKANGGKGKDYKRKNIKYSEKIYISNYHTKKGYTLVEYNTKKDGTGKGYSYVGDENVVSKLVSKNKGTLTLYAIWGYKVTYDFNTINNKFTRPYSPKKGLSKLLDPDKIYSDYKFLGWYKE